MTITINRKVLIAIIIALILVGIFYLANRANLIFRRFSATILSSLEGGVVTVPQKISNLVAVSGDEQVSLAWAAPIDGGSKITAYRIYRGESSNNLDFLTAISRESFTDSAVKNGTTYYYKVAAVNIMGEGPMSDAVNALPSISGSQPISKNDNGGAVVAPAVSVPSAINSLVAVSGNNLVSLAWSAPYNGGRPISLYKIYRGTWAGGETFLTSTNSSAFTDTNLSNNTAYYYRVSAVNSVGEGSLSNRVSANPTAYNYVYNAGLPGQISNLTAIPGDGQVSLSWSATSGSAITGYKIYRRDYYGNSAYVSTVSTNSFVNYGLSNGQTYYFRVSAVNSTGEGPMSAEVGATPVASSYYYYNYNQIPGQVTGLSANPGNNQVYLSWSTPSSGSTSVSYYKIYRSTDYYGDSFYTTAGSTSFIDASVSNGTTYYYRVSAVNSVGEGSLSNRVSATPYSTYVYYPPSNPKTAPGQITNLTAQNSSGYALLSWSTPYNGGSSIQNYKIYRGTSSGNLSLLATTQFTNYTDSSVSSGKNYYYKVSAVNSYGEGILSNQASVKIPSQTYYYDDDDDDDYVYVPSYSSEYVRITSLPSSVTEGQTFSVSWQSSSHFQGCRVWFQGSNITKDSLPTNGSASFSTSGIPAGTYEVGVRCFRPYEIDSMSNYKEDDYMTNSAYNSIGKRDGKNIVVIKAYGQTSTSSINGSYSCVCNDGTVLGGALSSGVLCSNVGGVETCVSKCLPYGGWKGGTSGFTCVNY